MHRRSLPLSKENCNFSVTTTAPQHHKMNPYENVKTGVKRKQGKHALTPGVKLHQFAPLRFPEKEKKTFPA